MVQKEFAMKQAITITIILIISISIYAEISTGINRTSGSLSVTVIIPDINKKESAASLIPSPPPPLHPPIEVADFFYKDGYIVIRVSNTCNEQCKFGILYSVRNIDTGNLIKELSLNDIEIKPDKTYRIKFPVADGKNLYIVSLNSDEYIFESAAMRYNNSNEILAALDNK